VPCCISNDEKHDVCIGNTKKKTHTCVLPDQPPPTSKHQAPTIHQPKQNKEERGKRKKDMLQPKLSSEMKKTMKTKKK